MAFCAQLLGNRHAIAAFDQARNIGVGGMIGYTRHRHAVIFTDGAAREDDVQLARHQFGVSIEWFRKSLPAGRTGCNQHTCASNRDIGGGWEVSFGE